MPELLYVSTGKLARWPTKARLAERLTGELNLQVAKVGLAPGTSSAAATQQLYDRVQRICRSIDRTPGFTRWLDGRPVPAGTWFTFDSRLRWGRIGRGVGKDPKEPVHNIVFFGGPVPHERPTVDLLMGGWSGHLMGEHGAHDPSGRMGSRLEDFFDIWSDISVGDKDGSFKLPSRLMRMRREKSRGDTLTLEEVFRMGYGTFDHALRHHPEVPLRGYAQCLAALPSSGHQLPMVIASPLFVEVSGG